MDKKIVITYDSTALCGESTIEVICHEGENYTSVSHKDLNNGTKEKIEKLAELIIKEHNVKKDT